VIRVPKTASVFHLFAQRSAFRPRDARRQSRLFACLALSALGDEIEAQFKSDADQFPAIRESDFVW
jgi:hypothetical protein